MSAVFIEESLSGLVDLEVSPFLPLPSSIACGTLFSSSLSEPAHL